MKYIFLSLAMASLSLIQAQTPNPKYNKALADSLGASEYGMKKYVLVILRTGTNKTTDKRFIDSCFKGHFSNMGVMNKAGKLVIAGPFGNNDKNYRGIFILNVPTLEEAKELVNGDSAIKEKLLEPEFIIWNGSAALPMYLPYHDKISKTNF
jgi:uncharacterized protein YciI